MKMNENDLRHQLGAEMLKEDDKSEILEVLQNLGAPYLKLESLRNGEKLDLEFYDFGDMMDDRFKEALIIHGNHVDEKNLVDEALAQVSDGWLSNHPYADLHAFEDDGKLILVSNMKENLGM